MNTSTNTKRQKLLEQRKLILKDYKTLGNKLKKDIDTAGLQYINLYAYINQLNKLETRLNKIEYLIALEID